MLMVVENLGNAGSEFQLEFDNLLLIVHYYTFRAAMKGLTGLDDQIAKISTSLRLILRHHPTLTDRGNCPLLKAS